MKTNPFNIFLSETGELWRFAIRFFKEGFKPKYEFQELLRQCFLIGNKTLPLVGITGFIMDKIIKDPSGSIGPRQLNEVFKEWFQMNYGNRKLPKLSEIEEIMIKRFGNKNTKTKKWMGIKFSEEEYQDDMENIGQES